MKIITKKDQRKNAQNSDNSTYQFEDYLLAMFHVKFSA